MKLFKNKKTIFIASVFMITVVLIIFTKTTSTQTIKRDEKRIHDIYAISNALQKYYNDYGELPILKESHQNLKDGECLGAEETTGIESSLKPYLNLGNTPLDPNQKANGVLCPNDANGRTGFYWYKPLTRSGVGNNSYVLCADVETFQKANTVLSSATANPEFTVKLDPAGATYEVVAPQVGPSGEQLTADSTPANASLYCITN